ncbi:hypothetical protein MB02_06125 [Croceicoccus estronivorus]|nr:hypothetical protein MB02_06125 [Croceicoccus estronivorus]
MSGRKLGIRTFILGVLVAFVLGAAAVGWVAWRNGFDIRSLGAPVPEQVDEEAAAAQTSADEDIKLEKPGPDIAAAAAEAVGAAEKVERVAEAQGGFDQRIAAMEQRLTRLDLQAQAASGNAARAEGLLIAFATRRAMERGAPLGYLADQLRLRFGDACPNAVRTIIEDARDPVTLDQLVARLEGISPALVKSPEGEGFWTRAQRELNNLFVIRRDTSPSPAPRRRLERAKMFLESGRVEAAVAEVKNMPGADADHVQDWVRDAERYAAAQAALDLIETTAVLDPHDLRDSRGKSVEQLSPAVEN